MHIPFSAPFRSFVNTRRCFSCSQPFDQPEPCTAQTGMRYFCSACLEQLHPKKTGYCPRCGDFFAWPGLPVSSCLQCLQCSPPWKTLSFYGSHEGLLRELLLQLKFKQGLHLAAPLMLLARQQKQAGCVGYELIIPIPLHTSRLLQRGYNQAFELAAALNRFESAGSPGKKLLHSKRFSLFRPGTPSQPNTDAAQKTRSARLAPALLTRVIPTRPQAGLSRKARRSNTLQAFSADPAVSGKNVLLIDDIITTGSTIKAAALALLEAGAREVHVLAVAKTPGKAY